MLPLGIIIEPLIIIRKGIKRPIMVKREELTTTSNFQRLQQNLHYIKWLENHKFQTNST